MSNAGIIMHNMSAMNANRMYGIVGGRRMKTSEKLSSGYRINRAADDAAGLSISEGMRRSIRGLRQGERNCQDGISLCQVADGALAEINDMLHRMTELSVQAANGTYSEEQRQYLQGEITQLTAEIDRISKETEFNGLPIFTGEKLNEGEGAMSLIESPSASKGYISEAYEKNGKYYASASLDFSGLNEEKIKKLYGKTFSFECSVGCKEQFSFTFNNSNSSSVDTLANRTPHHYQIGIAGCTTGSDVLNRLYDYVSANHPTYSGSSDLGGIKVSHSNDLIKVSDTKLVVAANGTAYTTKNQAETAFATKYTNSTHSGAVNFAEIAGVESDTIPHYDLWIHSGPEKENGMYLTVLKMNPTVLGINTVDVTSVEKAKQSIDMIAGATELTSKMRSHVGAQQNRLEHTINNVANIAENTDAAESRIRDTDMATEMVKHMNDNILEQVGQAMMAQANKMPEGLLSLLH
ncbi:MAG TPA: hypothetical protein DCG85_08225 [Lachnospiraceae bacterium]|nr:hypothetical protein [Lachnospiraceae bacterium]